MRQMRAKTAIFTAIGTVVLLLSAIAALLLLSGGDSGTVAEDEIPRIDQFEEKIHSYSTESEVMVGDGQTLYWPIFAPSNSSGVIVVTGVRGTLTWSDDENPPAYRPSYQNMPDTFRFTAVGVPMTNTENMDNSTGNTSFVQQSSTSNSGSTGLSLVMTSNPAPLKAGPSDNWTIPPEGISEPGDSGLFLSVECTAGDIRSSRPAMLYYNDQGDEVSMRLQIMYRVVPQEIFDHWNDGDNEI